MLKKLYRKFVPVDIKKRITVLRKGKVIYRLSWLLPKTEENRVYAFIGKHGLTPFPYEFIMEYKNMTVDIKKDPALGMPFVIHNNKKLYFPASYAYNKIITDYRNLIIEQDMRSPHRYVKSYAELKGKILFDIGSAEASFTLDVIDLIDHAYLFECDDLWTAALEATFAPWREKVTIVKKYVSNKIDESHITIDDFLKDKSKDNLFFKVDIEGGEEDAILGAANSLKIGKNISMSVCVYHRKKDAKIISNLMSSLGYSFEFTPGLMYWGYKISKGIIRGHN